MSRLLIMLAFVTFLAGCTFDPVRPQAVYEATREARALSLVPTVTVVPDIVPEPTACVPTIKGNIASNGEKIAHSPGQANYNNIVISPEKGEEVFCTIEEALHAGYRKALR